MKVSIFALLLGALTSCLPQGQKLLTLDVQRGGDVLLSTTFDAPDTSTPAEIWANAGEVPFSTERVDLEPSAADPLTAHIVGPVQLRILWVSDIESEVQLDGLVLVRSSAQSEDWRLPPTEVERAQRAAGL